MRWMFQKYEFVNPAAYIPILLWLIYRVKPALNCLCGHLHIGGDNEPSPKKRSELFLNFALSLFSLAHNSIWLGSPSTTSCHGRYIERLLPSSRYAPTGHTSRHPYNTTSNFDDIRHTLTLRVERVRKEGAPLKSTARTEPSTLRTRIT